LYYKTPTLGLKESGIILFGNKKGESPLSFTENGKKRLKQNAAQNGAPLLLFFLINQRIKAAIYTYE
jgi:hypothetical protein